MAKIYKSARGKSVDIDQIKLSNETAIAIGNMKVNARGDKLGPGATVAMPRNQVMDRAYQIDNSSYSPNNPEHFAEAQMNKEPDRARELSDLANSLVVTSNEEEASTPSNTPAEPAARGSLASSIAKTTTVVQAPMPKPNKKPLGPSRI